ncbi:MAG: class I SAM-dependent methyltransferase [Planctomycetota bacterium]|jgi:methyltransferase (TIGR00027 family)
MSFVVFLVLQILFLPLAIMGALLVLFKQMVVSKRLGVSQTAIEVLNGRWTMHIFELRKDDATERLARAVPNTSLFGLWLCFVPLWVRYKISGVHWGYPRIPQEGAETMMDLVPARTVYFDRILQRVIGGMEQFVLLGAGYDTRAYGDLRRDGLTIFELDQAAIQRHKITSLEKAGIDVAQVRFVPVDFSRDEAFERLQAAGYDPAKKTVFLWEGVTPYLAEADVRKTMGDIRSHAPAESVLVADIYAEQFTRRGKKGTIGGKVLAYTGEMLDFGLPFANNYEQALQQFAQSENLTLRDAFFLGRERKQGPFAVVAAFEV